MVEKTVSRGTFKVGNRFTCTMTLANGTVNTVWSPKPTNGLSKKELKDYRAGRAAFIAEALPGVKVGVIEI